MLNVRETNKALQIYKHAKIFHFICKLKYLALFQTVFANFH